MPPRHQPRHHGLAVHYIAIVAIILGPSLVDQLAASHERDLERWECNDHAGVRWWWRYL